MGVLRQTNRKRRLAQQADDIRGQRFFVAHARQQSSPLVLDQIWHALRRSADHGSSRRKRFNHRQRHVVEPRGIDKDIRMVVTLTDFLAQRDAREVDASELQVRNQLADVGFQRAVADQIEARYVAITSGRRGAAGSPTQHK